MKPSPIRIHILQDLFRNRTCGLPSIAENAHWLHDMLRLATAGLPVHVEIFLARADGGLIDTDSIIDRLQVPPTVCGWARMVTQPGLASAPEIQQILLCDIAIGFGLTPAMLLALDGCGVRVLDIEMSPLRFGHRQYLRARTNCSKIGEALGIIEVDRDDIVHNAQALAGRHARSRFLGRRRPPQFSDPAIGVLLGQMHVDLSLVADRRIASLQDDEVFEQVRNLAAEVSELYVLPHPLVADRLGNLHRVLAEIPNAILDSRPSYAFLTEPGTRWVAALSSGSLVEAKCFGITTHKFIVPDRDNADRLPAKLGEWKDVHDTLFSPKFWRAIVAGKRIRSRLPLPEPGLIKETLVRATGASIDDPPHDPLPTLVPGSQYPITLSNRYGRILRFGWNEPESWGTWSMGAYACIAFRLKSEQAALIELEMVRYAPHPALAPDVRMRKPGATGFEPLVWDGERGTVRVEVPANGGETVCSLLLQISVPISPWSVGQSADTRSLGVAVSRISIKMLEDETSASEVDNRRLLADAECYSILHRLEFGYRDNNGLSPFTAALARLRPQRVVECGTGDGAFALAMAAFAPQVIGVDCDASPMFPFGCRGVSFQLWSALQDALPAADLACSADFLDHFPPQDTERVLRKLLAAAKFQFHVIACFDDGHSHLTNGTGNAWLAKFQAAATTLEEKSDNLSYRICDAPGRSAETPATIITNIPLHILGF